MGHAMLDTLAYAKKMKDAGFTEKQAEAQAEALIDVLSNAAASKEDVNTAKSDLSQDMAKVRTDLSQDIAKVRTDLSKEIGDVRTDLSNRISDVRMDLSKEITKVHTDLSKEIGEVRADVGLLRWMVGFVVALSVAILIKLIA